MMLCFNISDIAIITVKNVGYCSIIHNISRSEVIYLFKKLCLMIVDKYKMNSGKLKLKSKSVTILTI